jgi:hypothetical protein
MTSPKFSFFDRHGHPLTRGQTVIVQHCVGKYGQVRKTQGVLKSIGNHQEVYVDTGREGEGNCLHPGFTLDKTLGESCMRGYHRHHDFEHGHEKWIEIVSG